MAPDHPIYGNNPVALKRFLTILYVALISAVALYLPVMEFLAAQREPRDPGAVRWALQGLSVLLTLAALYLRFGLLKPLLAQPLYRPEDFAAQAPRLRVHYIIAYALTESVALLGFVLRFLGGTREDALPFFVVAAGLFLLCYPRLPQTFAQPGAPGSN